MLAPVLAQKGDYPITDRSDWKERIYFGGGFGLSAGSGSTIISLSPLVGYMINSKLSAGVGVTYQYQKFSNTNFSTNLYGGSLFLRYNLIYHVFAYASYEFINYDTNPFIDGAPRETIGRLPLGLGISQPIGPHASFNILAAYDALYNDLKGPYNSPWVFTVFFSI